MDLYFFSCLFCTPTPCFPFEHFAALLDANAAVLLSLISGALSGVLLQFECQIHPNPILSISVGSSHCNNGLWTVKESGSQGLLSNNAACPAATIQVCSWCLHAIRRGAALSARKPCYSLLPIFLNCDGQPHVCQRDICNSRKTVGLMLMT